MRILEIKNNDNQTVEIVFENPIEMYKYWDKDMMSIEKIKWEPIITSIVIPKIFIQWWAENNLTIDKYIKYSNMYWVEKYKCNIWSWFTIINKVIDILSNRNIHIPDQVRYDCIKSFYEYRNDMIDYNRICNHWNNKFITMKYQIIEREKKLERLRNNKV